MTSFLLSTGDSDTLYVSFFCRLTKLPFKYDLGVVTPFIEYTVVHASAGSIMLIAFVRYLIAFKSFTQMKTFCNQVNKLLVLVWIISSLTSLPIIATGAIYNSTECLHRVDTLWSKIYLTSMIVVFFIMPAMSLLIIYSAIIREIRSFSKHSLSNTQSVGNELSYCHLFLKSPTTNISPAIFLPSRRISLKNPTIGEPETKNHCLNENAHPCHRQIKRQHFKNKNVKQIVHLTIAMISCFFFTNLPYQICLAFAVFVPGYSNGMRTGNFLSMLAIIRLINSLGASLNPLILLMMSRRLRLRVSRLLIDLPGPV
ncbi:hypothetical protein ACOME3_006035 [Neoechinorhynchus agilis]